MGLFGSGSINTSGQEAQIQQSREMLYRLFGMNNSANAPFLAGGTGAFNMLTDLLGINVPQSALPANAAPYTPNYKSHPEIPRGEYYLTADKVYKKDGDQVYVAPRGPKNFYDLFEPLAAPVQERSENFGSLLEPFTLDKFQESPNYQFVKDQGEQALARQQAARGNYFSPAAMQQLGEFNTGLASGEFNNAYTMYNQNQDNVFNRLMGVTNVGMNALGNQLGINNNFGQGMINLNDAKANLLTAKQESKANSRQSAFGNLMNLGSLAGQLYTGGMFPSFGGGGAWNNIASNIGAANGGIW